MIEEIRITDLGVIADAPIEFDRGLTAITGETGAGKTMVLSGLALLLGGKADPASVRPGCSGATVEGRFRPPQGHPAYAQADEAGAILDDDALLVVRSVPARGRSRAHLGGRSVPQGLLGEIGADLVTVHGQSDQLRLRSPAQQRQALDEFAGPEHVELVRRHSRVHTARRRAEEELRSWDGQAQARAEELQRLTEATERIEALAPQEGEDEDLRLESERLANVEDLRTAAEEAHQAIAGQEDPAAPEGALALIDQARRALGTAADHDTTLTGWIESLDALTYQLSDLLTEMGSYITGLEADPQRLDYIHQRRAAITDLVRSYTEGPDLAALLTFAAHAQQRIGELTAPGAGREDLIERIGELTEEQQDLAAQITRGRTAAAEAMTTAVTSELHALAMAGASVQIELEELDEEGPYGAENIQILLSPHPGAPPRPLGKGASGGELSRMMLAIEVALAREQSQTSTVGLPTFVFDEVDAGVGGQAAVEVGRRLAELARHAQVIVVTHLPQVAAFADRHLVVSKNLGSGATAITGSDIRTVTGTERETELARMLSGDPHSDAARHHAAELLDRRDVGAWHA